MKRVSVPERVGLFVTDFDGTLVDTFSTSPNGLTVPIAYERALTDIFGCTGLLEAIGGLKNCAPTEIIKSVLAMDCALLEKGLAFVEREASELERLVIMRGVPSFGELAGRPVELLAEALVRVKLRLLLGEISPEWPALFPGVADVFRLCKERGVKVGVISSGHEIFIRRCCDVHGLPCPDVFLTDDDLRGSSLPVELKSKPSAFLFEQFLASAADRFGRRFAREEIIYFGDDSLRDGGLAANAGVRFGWFNPKRRVPEAPLPDDAFEFSDWQQVYDALHTSGAYA